MSEGRSAAALRTTSRRRVNTVAAPAQVYGRCWAISGLLWTCPYCAFVDDPNLTDKKFPGNRTQSYRSQMPLEVVGEIKTWVGHPPEVLQQMKDSVERARQLGVEAID